MKYKFYLVVGIISISVISCEKSEHAFVETETILDFEVLMKSEEATTDKSGAAVSASEIPFSGEGSYTGFKITNVDNRLYRIKNVRPHHVPYLTISGITEGVEFTSLHLEWGYKGPTDMEYFMQEPVDLLPYQHQLTDGVYKVGLENSLVQLINKLNQNPENTIKVVLRGTSNHSFNSVANLEIPIIVESETMNLRFELF